METVTAGDTLPPRTADATVAPGDADARTRAGRGPNAIPRGLEMLYIKHDLRRMIYTAVALLVFMVVLLVILSAIS
ncbi:MAG TPA: hypothetical protein VGR16_00130 [Thermomicrobiales bacterium]|nr:hypothetical protein [Thermomicrobiales bacterium]